LLRCVHFPPLAVDGFLADPICAARGSELDAHEQHLQNMTLAS
jgi:hypothetical protein